MSIASTSSLLFWAFHNISSPSCCSSSCIFWICSMYHFLINVKPVIKRLFYSLTAFQFPSVIVNLSLSVTGHVSDMTLDVVGWALTNRASACHCSSANERMIEVQRQTVVIVLTEGCAWLQGRLVCCQDGVGGASFGMSACGACVMHRDKKLWRKTSTGVSLLYFMPFVC